MKNTFGNSVSITIFGESHGEAIGIVIDGLAPGIWVNRDFISHQLTLRRPAGAISTKRQEPDEYRILSGVKDDFTTGTPITIEIPNVCTKSGDYSAFATIARPSHADFTAECKYHGFQDSRGGGHFSGRITAPIVAAGAIAISALKSKGIKIATHIKSCGGIEDRDFINLERDIEFLNATDFAVFDSYIQACIVEKITTAAAEGDSLGGTLQTAVTGMPAGVGEPWFDTVEGILSHALFSIPAVKGVEFGDGFKFANMKGSMANDPFMVNGDKIETTKNSNGGVNGGITNGMPIIFKTVIKPTPSIYKEQQTVDFKKKTNVSLKIEGRHDPAIIHRARVVQDSITALVLCDMLAQRYGTDYLGKNI